jgi:LPXTG-site transpeptidase (sortase) family protein
LLTAAVFLPVISFAVIKNQPKMAAVHSAPSVTAVLPKATMPPANQIYYGLPTRFKIPTLGVDASIEYLGKTAQGNMLSPKSASSVGWYKYGAIPGETGSAVLAAHVVGPQGQAGVFAQVKKLQAGDEIQVIDAKGQIILFTVTQTRKYSQSEQPSEVFNSTSGAHLNLITCAGEWDAINKHFLERLVVFADKSS